MKQNALTALLTFALMGALAVPAFAAETPLSQPAKPPISQPDTPHRYPIQVNGQTVEAQACVIVPLRAVAEPLGFTVTWKDGTVLVDNGIVHTVVTIGVDRYVTSTSKPNLVGTSAPFSLGAVPYVKDGVTYVPLGLFRVLLGNRADAVRLEDNRIVIQTQTTQIPNPFVTCKDLKEAQALAGFSLTAPDRLPDGLSETVIRAVKSQMIEMIFSAPQGGDALRLRKAVGTSDISGDYTVYQETETADVSGVSVTLRGNQGKIQVATWTADGFAYSLSMTPGMSRDQVSSLVSAVQ